MIALLGATLLSTAVPTAAQERWIGEITLVGFTFAPRGTVDADGQLLDISQHSALFSLYGTTYGGDGRTTFGLPDLRGRSVIHRGQGPGLANYNLGARGGSENVTLSAANMPSHTHGVTINAASTEGDSDIPTDNVWASVDRTDLYSTGAPDVTMDAAAASTQAVGGGQPFNIRDPYLTLRYVVSLVGTFPSRN